MSDIIKRNVPVYLTDSDSDLPLLITVDTIQIMADLEQTRIGDMAPQAVSYNCVLVLFGNNAINIDYFQEMHNRLEIIPTRNGLGLGLGSYKFNIYYDNVSIEGCIVKSISCEESPEPIGAFLCYTIDLGVDFVRIDNG
jgi:hypothetical protein